MSRAAAKRLKAIDDSAGQRGVLKTVPLLALPSAWERLVTTSKRRPVTTPAG